MGFGGISPLSLLLILGIIVLLFGTKKLRNIGGDIGTAIKNFKSSVSSNESNKDEGNKGKQKIDNASGRIIDAEVDAKSKDKV